MWYEQVYSGIVTTGLVMVSLYISGPYNWLDTGRLRRREISSIDRQQATKRDHRLTGNYYVIRGIESIAD